ncbi:uncharacterized protein L3040_003711 [Drepanopeziza brunnea f. sp. 'multigermtubi']|uniref:uncharacterized protein n=1 Tax=Drepanopeziza brunnea f. sp. 'multigermtubi' TaxID=698441 RepID=UPI00238E67CA|nr:hypothetical protein L3040_003711 [Drepanopeziza brunnea f. sp. 'multigermtubi']
MSASLAPECNDAKERYDSCFLKWYSEKYLRGQATTDECEPLFKDYKKCLTVALKERGANKLQNMNMVYLMMYSIGSGIGTASGVEHISARLFSEVLVACHWNELATNKIHVQKI